MTRLRRPLLRLLGTTALLVATGLAVMPAGGAEEPAGVGWWYRDVPLSGDDVQGQSVGSPVIAGITSSSASSSQVPPPPVLPPAPVPTIPPSVTVPDPGQNVPTPSAAPSGGLLVAADVSGPRAMSALRFDVPDAGGAVLRLTIATGSTPSPGVRACPALTDWQPGPDQSWSRRPAHDCDRLAVSSSLSPDGTTVSWALPDTFKDPSSRFYDVLLVPLSGDGTPFQVAFDKPGGSSFTVTSAAPEIEPYDSGNIDFGGPAIDPFYNSDGFDFSVGSEPYSDTPVETVLIEPTGRQGGAQGLTRLPSALENPAARRVAALMLVLLGGYAYWQSGRSVQRRPHLLGALGEGSVGIAAVAPARPRGIGRFSRERPERPPRL